MTTITHDPITQRFFVNINGHTAYLSYITLTDTLWDYNHTIVPDVINGQGVGGQLARYALDYAKAQGKQVQASCSFIAHYIDTHPEYADVLAR